MQGAPAILCEASRGSLGTDGGTYAASAPSARPGLSESRRCACRNRHRVEFLQSVRLNAKKLNQKEPFTCEDHWNDFARDMATWVGHEFKQESGAWLAQQAQQMLAKCRSNEKNKTIFREWAVKWRHKVPRPDITIRSRCREYAALGGPRAPP